jgi:CRP-like cAMP-binding protein
MYQNLLKLVKSEVAISEAEAGLCKEFFRPYNGLKDQLLVEAGKVPEYLFFVDSGFVRIYYSCRGKEITTRIGGPGEFITAFDSYVSSRSARETVQCITDASLLRICKPDLDALYMTSRAWAGFIRIIYQRFILHSEKRCDELISESVDFRLNRLIGDYPAILKLVPVKYIASFLGVSVEKLKIHLMNRGDG